MPSPTGGIRHRDNHCVSQLHAPRCTPPPASLHVRRLLLQRRLRRVLQTREATRRRDDAIKCRFAALQRRRRLLESDSDESSNTVTPSSYKVSHNCVRTTMSATRENSPLADGDDCSGRADDSGIQRSRSVSRCPAGMFTVSTPWGVANTRLAHVSVCKRLEGIAATNGTTHLRKVPSKRTANASVVGALCSPEDVCTRLMNPSRSTPKESTLAGKPKSWSSPLGTFSRVRVVRRKVKRTRTETKSKKAPKAIKSTSRRYPKTLLKNGFKCTWC